HSETEEYVVLQFLRAQLVGDADHHLLEYAAASFAACGRLLVIERLGKAAGSGWCRAHRGRDSERYGWRPRTAVCPYPTAAAQSNRAEHDRQILSEGWHVGPHQPEHGPHSGLCNPSTWRIEPGPWHAARRSRFQR